MLIRELSCSHRPGHWLGLQSCSGRKHCRQRGEFCEDVGCAGGRSFWLASEPARSLRNPRFRDSAIHQALDAAATVLSRYGVAGEQRMEGEQVYTFLLIKLEGVSHQYKRSHHRRGLSFVLSIRPETIL